MAVETKKPIDFSKVTFNNVDLSGMDLRGCDFAFKSSATVLALIVSYGAAAYLSYRLFGPSIGDPLALFNTVLTGCFFTLLPSAYRSSPRAMFAVCLSFAIDILALAGMFHLYNTYTRHTLDKFDSGVLISFAGLGILYSTNIIFKRYGGFLVAKCTFNKANMRATTWNNASVSTDDFVGADLTEAAFTNSWISDCLFTTANLTKLRVVRSPVASSGFEGSIAQKASLAYSTIKDCYFNNCDLTGAGFVETKINNTTFRDANVADANFAKAKFNNVDLTGAIANKKTRWPKGFDPEAAGVLFTEQLTLHAAPPAQAQKEDQAV